MKRRTVAQVHAAGEHGEFHRPSCPDCVKAATRKHATMRRKVMAAGHDLEKLLPNIPLEGKP